MATKIGQTASQPANQGANQPANQAGGPGQGTGSTPPPGPMETGGSALGVGSYNRAAWMKKEGVVKSGDKYYKLIQLADSSTAWKEVQIPPDILAQGRATAGKVSEIQLPQCEGRPTRGG